MTNIDSLKDLIYNTACNMQSPGAFGGIILLEIEF